MQKEIKIQKIDETLNKLYNSMPKVSELYIKDCAIAIALLERQKKKLENDN